MKQITWQNNNQHYSQVYYMSHTVIDISNDLSVVYFRTRVQTVLDEDTYV